VPMISNFSFCPHCVAKGKQREIRPATRRTPHVSRSDGDNFHLFLEESMVSRPSGATGEQVAALFRYAFDSTGQKSESTLVTIRPAAATGDLVLRQLEHCADRLAAILEKGAQLEKTYTWTIDVARQAPCASQIG
jgi:hypothetical protein